MEKVTVLNLGCGRAKSLPPWAGELEFDDGEGGTVRPENVQVIHVDEMASVNPDIVCKLGRDHLQIFMERDSVDVAFAIHVLEHIGRQGELREWFAFWEDLYTVMKPGARLYFECPYHTSVWCWADPTHTRAISEQTFVYIDQDKYRMGGAIPDYRPNCDWVLENRVLLPNEQLREANAFIRGVLQARKPLRPYWEDRKTE